MAPAEEGVALAATSPRRRRRVSWGAAFCFGSRRERGEEALTAEGATPLERWSRRRKRRTVPVVDGDLVPGTAGRNAMRRGADDDKESRKGRPRLQGCCCFLAPVRTPGRQHGTVDSGSGRSTHGKQRQLEHAEQQPPPPRRRSPSGEPAPSQTQATDGSRTRAPTKPSDNEEPSKGEASPRGKPCPKASSAGVGAFGPVVGLSVVAAVSMAGLLGGRVWAIACVCAWFAALSGLRRREAGSGTAGSGGSGSRGLHGLQEARRAPGPGVYWSGMGQRP